MSLETRSNTPSSFVSDVEELSIGSNDGQSQIELPEHDEHLISYDGITYKCGKARPAKRREKSPHAWY